MNEIRFVAAQGVAGAGVDAAALEAALAYEPHFIACDGGTTDAGPFSLGSGEPAFARAAVKADLAAMLAAGGRAGIPVLVGSAGTAGGAPHLAWAFEIVREIVAESSRPLRVATVAAELDKATLLALLRAGKVRALDPAPRFDAATIERSVRIVGMMGVEPLQAALALGAELVLAGRCSDSALFAALPIARGFPAGLAWHAGKIAECGTLACETAGPGVLVVTIRHDEAIVTPVGAGLRCTPVSVAAHSLYENADPYRHVECSGTLDLSATTFSAVDERRVRVTGSAFEPADEYTVKLEGAERIGYQSLIIGGIRDPYLIARLDAWLATVRHAVETMTARLLGDQLGPQDYALTFTVYGRDAVMGALEPLRDQPGHEVGIVFAATAPTQALATAIASFGRQPLLHTPIPEWSGAITGFACLHNPAVLERGAVYRFNVNSVVVPPDPLALFPIAVHELEPAVTRA
ncbi:MAG: acyclic terpene utilization AtuA family protein [Candidatus Velthaea sp.]